MLVSVWDTYVRKKDGAVMHFDIIVADDLQDADTIYTFGKTYLASKGEEGQLASQQCQFCHIESPSAEVISAINRQGYYILEMDDIPAELPQNPSRRDLILHLRAHSATHRFANFRATSSDRLLEMVHELTK